MMAAAAIAILASMKYHRRLSGRVASRFPGAFHGDEY
jgi:hypothetical protein